MRWFTSIVHQHHRFCSRCTVGLQLCSQLSYLGLLPFCSSVLLYHILFYPILFFMFQNMFAFYMQLEGELYFKET